MKLIILSLALVFTGMVANAQKLNINTDDAEVKFEFPADKTSGTISGFKCEIEFDMKNLSKSKMTGTVDVNTLETANKGRDKHLKSADFFDVAKFPTMKFVSTEMVEGKTGVQMTGDLTIKDKTLPCTINFKYEEGVFKGKTTIDASKYGVSPGKKEGTVNITFIIPIAK
ncbi:MAG: polyisoprenoid-binding protein YceI [Parvicellaceae bacterium]|jgi:polyisoprenoid-binding protein YceI